jgi:hypothetical protein
MRGYFLICAKARAWLLVGAFIALASAQAAAEGTVQKMASTADGYCHLKIPAIRPSTLSTGRPEFKSSTTSDFIDFYGPCDHDPKSKAAVVAQKHNRSRWYTKF